MAKKQGRHKHIPQRTCVGCRQVLSKRSLVRIVRSLNGVRIDPTGKLPGRGAYLHDDPECWDKGLNGALDHALKTNLTSDERKLLLAFVEEFLQEKGHFDNSQTRDLSYAKLQSIEYQSFRHLEEHSRFK